MSALLRNGIFRTLVFAQCLVVIGAIILLRTFHGPAEHSPGGPSVSASAWLRLLRGLGAARQARYSLRTPARRTTEPRPQSRAQMLGRHKDTPKILQALTEAVAHHSPSHSCALHLLEGETLTLAAQSSLPPILADRIQQLATSKPVRSRMRGPLSEGRLRSSGSWPGKPAVVRTAACRWGAIGVVRPNLCRW